MVQATGGAGAEGAKVLFKIPRTSSGSNVASLLSAGDLCYNFDKGHVEVYNLKTASVAFTSTPADGKKTPPPFGSLGKDAPSSRAPSAAWAGSQIVLPFADGRVLFLDPGAPPKSAATATLEPMAGSLFFQGDRIYARSVKALICVGPGK